MSLRLRNRTENIRGYKPNQTCHHRPQPLSLRTAKEWNRPDTMWTDGSRQEDGAVGAACVWRSPGEEGGWTGRRHRQSPWRGVARGVCGGDVLGPYDEGRHGGQIQGDSRVDHGPRATRTTLSTTSWEGRQAHPVETSEKDPRRALLPATVRPCGDGNSPSSLWQDGHASLLVVRQRRAPVQAPPIHEVPGMAIADGDGERLYPDRTNRVGSFQSGPVRFRHASTGTWHHIKRAVKVFAPHGGLEG